MPVALERLSCTTTAAECLAGGSRAPTYLEAVGNEERCQLEIATSHRIKNDRDI